MNEFAGFPYPESTDLTIAARSIAYEIARLTCLSPSGGYVVFQSR